MQMKCLVRARVHAGSGSRNARVAEPAALVLPTVPGGAAKEPMFAVFITADHEKVQRCLEDIRRALGVDVSQVWCQAS
jgi:hypothetical protein